MPTGLNYAAPELARSRPRLYQIAFFCALAPLPLEIGTALLWLITRMPVLKATGALLIPIGSCILLVLGTGALIGYVINQRRVHGSFHGMPMKRVVLALGLLLVDLAVDYTCAFGGMYLMDCRLVRVVNRSSTTVTDFAIGTPEVFHRLGAIAPGQIKTCRFQIIAELENVDYLMSQSGKESEGVIEKRPYYLSGPFTYTIVVKDDGVTIAAADQLW